MSGIAKKLVMVVSKKFSKKKEKSDVEENSSLGKVNICHYHVKSNVSNRYAVTLITSKVQNLNQTASETTFSVILPENAFISEFEMEIENKVYKAYVKEKEEAKQEYQQAVARGQSAAHVGVGARDSKTFTVSVNIEPESEAIFRLTYEELLVRQLGQYEIVINIHPGQIVEDLDVQVKRRGNINETKSLAFVRTPSLRTGNQISNDEEELNPLSKIDTIDSNSAIVKFKPDTKQQKKFAKNLGSTVNDGMTGQFVVQYDVERDSQNGEILVRDGYFVHFFAPAELQPLPKHVVFVLDYSGSMSGRKIQQLIKAMENILDELKSEDLFNIVRFSEDASVWNSEELKFSSVVLTSQNFGHLESDLREAALPGAAKATKKNIKMAKRRMKELPHMNSTNIILGLEVGLFLVKKAQEDTSYKHQPLIIFLTDGCPNTGMSDENEITHAVTTINCSKNRAAIFSLSFGEDANKSFLRKLSAQNLGFSRHIYEAADASLQLQDFYNKISSPLLSDITFKYVDGVSDVTQTQHPIFFNGSELVVAGKTSNRSNILLRIFATCFKGGVEFEALRREPVGSLERLWAYLTVKQTLEKAETAIRPDELKKRALDLALKYSFVTSVSSLVVVKPDSKGTQIDDQNLAKKGYLQDLGMCQSYNSLKCPTKAAFGFLNARSIKDQTDSKKTEKDVALSVNSNMTEDMIKEGMEETFEFRRKSKYNNPDQFHIFLDKKGLISYEFSMMYANYKSFSDCFPKYIEPILTLYKEKSKNPLSHITDGDDDRGWEKEVRSLFALIHLLQRDVEKSSSSSLDFPLEDHLIIFQEANFSEESVLKTSKGNHPFILAVGSNKAHIETYYIVYHQEIIPTSRICEEDNFLSSFDLVFKLHFVYNLKFNKKLETFWKFVQAEFYGIDKKVRFTSKMKEVKNKLTKNN